MRVYNLNDIDGIEYENPRKEVAKEVETAFRQMGYKADLTGLVSPRPGSEPDKAGVAVTPDTSEAIQELFESGFGWLKARNVSAFFGDSRGSANITTAFVKEGLTVTEMLERIDEATYDDEQGASMIQKGIAAIDFISTGEDPHDPVDLMAYQVYLKALGWLAEGVLEATGDFKKGSTSQDEGGIDLWHNGEQVQLKTIVRAASQGAGNLAEKEIPHWVYGWTTDGIVVAPVEEIQGGDVVAGEIAADAPDGVGKTNVKKSIKTGITKDYPRPARAVWW